MLAAKVRLEEKKPLMVKRVAPAGISKQEVGMDEGGVLEDEDFYTCENL